MDSPTLTPIEVKVLDLDTANSSTSESSDKENKTPPRKTHPDTYSEDYSSEKFQAIKNIFESNKIKIPAPKAPYEKTNGKMSSSSGLGSDNSTSSSFKRSHKPKINALNGLRSESDGPGNYYKLCHNLTSEKRSSSVGSRSTSSLTSSSNSDSSAPKLNGAAHHQTKVYSKNNVNNKNTCNNNRDDHTPKPELVPLTDSNNASKTVNELNDDEILSLLDSSESTNEQSQDLSTMYDENLNDTNKLCDTFSQETGCQTTSKPDLLYNQLVDFDLELTDCTIKIFQSHSNGNSSANNSSDSLEEDFESMISRYDASRLTEFTNRLREFQIEMQADEIIRSDQYDKLKDYVDTFHNRLERLFKKLEERKMSISSSGRSTRVSAYTPCNFEEQTEEPTQVEEKLTIRSLQWDYEGTTADRAFKKDPSSKEDSKVINERDEEQERRSSVSSSGYDTNQMSPPESQTSPREKTRSTVEDVGQVPNVVDDDEVEDLDLQEAPSFSQPSVFSTPRKRRFLKKSSTSTDKVTSTCGSLDDEIEKIRKELAEKEVQPEPRVLTFLQLMGLAGLLTLALILLVVFFVLPVEVSTHRPGAFSSLASWEPFGWSIFSVSYPNGPPPC